MWKLKTLILLFRPLFDQCRFIYKPLSYHFPCFADGLVLVYVSIFGRLLLFDFVHDGIDGKAEAGHARQVTDGEVKLQRAVFPRVVRASAALTAHRRLAQQLRAVEEPRPNLDLGTCVGVKIFHDIFT